MRIPAANGREAVTAIGVAAASFLAVTPLLAALRIPGAWALLMAASVGATAVAYGSSWLWRRPALVSYALSLAGLVILLLAACGPHPVAVDRGLAHGPNWLLTETLPIGGSRSVMAAAVVLAWLAAAATAEITVRSGRTRAGGDVSLLVPLAVYVLTYASAASAPGQGHVAGPVLLAILVGLALLRSGVRAELDVGAGEDGGPGRSSHRSALRGAGAMAVVILVLALVIPSAPSMAAKPTNLDRAAPTETGLVVDPVDTMAQLRDANPKAAAVPVLSIDIEQPSSGYLASAILDDYDGGIWSFATTFQPTGGRIPAPPQSAGFIDNNAVVQKVTVSSPLPVPFLPALDRPESVAGLEVVADPVTGMILPAHAGSATSYTVTSQAPALTLAEIPPADSLADPTALASLQPDLALPPGASPALATTMKFLVSLTGQRPAANVSFLQAVLNSLHTKERRVEPAPAAPPSPARTKTARTKTPRSRPSPPTTVPPQTTTIGGTSLSDVINSITVDRSATPEQFATLYAMVARYVGVPARIVTGFRLVPSSGSASLPAGDYQVTGRQAWAWDEIFVAGIGWVVVDPTPDVTTTVATPPPAPAHSPATTIPPRTANAVPKAEITGGHAVAKATHLKVSRPLAQPWWEVALLALAGFVLILILVGPGLAVARRWWRRRGRRSGDGAEMAIGAWLEMLDGLGRAGMALPPGSTSSEIAEEAGVHFGPDVAPKVARVGSLADRAVFSPNDPPDSSSALEVWALQHDLGQAVLRGLDRRQRARALLSVGGSPRHPSRPARR